MKLEASGQWVFGISAVLALSVMACGSSNDPQSAPPATPVHWTYEGLEGPEHWGELATDYAACASGTHQSPIDIPASIPAAPLDALAFHYAAAPATIVDNGHTVQVNLTDTTNELTIDGEAYSLVQFHFHAHSEHAVGGQYKPLEMHLVHRSASGGLAVVGVLFEMGAANAALSAVFDTMGSATGQAMDLAAALDPSALLPDTTEGWAYSGSLTTPPCTEGVKWHVLSRTLQVSEAQLEAFTSRHEISYRPAMENSSTVTSGD
jgi:carbonic anhydrase